MTEDVLDAHRRLVAANWPADLPREVQYPIGQRTLPEHVRHWAATRGAEDAIIYYGHTMSWAELDRLSDSLAALLARHGIAPGDRVALCLPNCPQYTIGFLGILKAGAIVVPVNPLVKAVEFEHYLRDSGATALIVQDRLHPIAQQAGLPPLVLTTALSDYLPARPTYPPPPGLDAPRTVPDGATDLLPALAAEHGPVPMPAIGWDSIAALNYTGGTTGLPKGCVHTQGDKVYTAACALTYLTIGAGHGPHMNFLPMFWIAGEDSGVLLPVVGGRAAVLLNRWDAGMALAAIAAHRVTSVHVLADSAAEMLAHPAAATTDLSSLADVTASSLVKVLDADLRRRFQALTGCVLREAAYGMTETNTMDTFTWGFQDSDRDLAADPVFVGLPMPSTDFRITDFTTGADLPLGETGEIRIRTPSQLKSYWQKDAATAEAIVDGWLRTGDMGRIDDWGCVHYLGRRKEMLKVNGMSVFPTEVEMLLARNPDIAASGVVGRADERRGQVPVAFVRLVPGSTLTAEALGAWCRGNMATYKVPEIRLMDSLPMTATGKVKRGELAALL
ncbi:AMP-binding protein [Acidisphaera rubrifaciens]|uniref:Acyl-CoA synthetase n=1 Tax=Acidisphaera rubrifaciens HS-AP3 TaxID=1231350 RepID=A0A0D6PBF7_9PROT|nr:AMP-binding protein [Acidisphaera rubrifaciens]GAN78543.1 acyl-CoA synthetase [Acidisphaera rubrifaciens HS-AP3]